MNLDDSERVVGIPEVTPRGFSPPSSRRWSHRLEEPTPFNAMKTIELRATLRYGLDLANLRGTEHQRCLTDTRFVSNSDIFARRRNSRCSENRHSSGIVAPKSKKGFRLERRKPFVFYTEMVAGDRNAPNAPHLIIPFRFELVREVAA
jgi:hypothetical protein